MAHFRAYRPKINLPLFFSLRSIFDVRMSTGKCVMALMRFPCTKYTEKKYALNCDELKNRGKCAIRLTRMKNSTCIYINHCVASCTTVLYTACAAFSNDVALFIGRLFNFFSFLSSIMPFTNAYKVSATTSHSITLDIDVWFNGF